MRSNNAWTHCRGVSLGRGLLVSQDGMGCVVVVVCAQGPLVKLISLCGFTGQ